MGKCKKRIFNKVSDKKGMALTRKDAIANILKNFKNSKHQKEVENLISLFGISIEELLEAGAAYEDISAIKYMFI